MKKYLPFLAALSLITIACSSHVPRKADSLPFEVVEEGAYGTFQEAGYKLITDQDAFSSLWQELHAHTLPVPPLPEIDLSDQAVVCVYMGTQNSGGFSIRITSVSVHQNIAYISVVTTSPGEGCMTTSALTSPYVMATIPSGSFANHELVVQKETSSCRN